MRPHLPKKGAFYLALSCLTGPRVSRGTGAARNLKLSRAHARVGYITLAAAVSLLSLGCAHATDIIGGARVIDGDTIAIGSRAIRLHGIDAPETDQMCLDSHGTR